MNDIHCIRTKFWLVDESSENYPSKCYRVLTEKGTFYFLADQFKDITVLDQLSYGDDIYIGSHQLEDGTYWLHWLLSNQKGELTVRQTMKFTLLQKITLVLLIPIFVLFILSFTEASIALAIIFYFLMVINLMQFCYYLGCFYLPKQRKLRQSFIQAKSGTMALISFDNSSAHMSQLPAIDTNIDSDFEILAGEVQSVVTTVSYNKKGHCYFNMTLCVKGRNMFLSETVSSLNDLLVPHCYYQTHPTFIKEDDSLTILLADNKVRAIVNHTDTASYLICKSTWLSKKRIRAILIYIYSMLIPGLIILPFILIPIGGADKTTFFVWLISSVMLLFTIPLLFIGIYRFCNLFIDHSSTIYALSWLKKLLGNRDPKEI